MILTVFRISLIALSLHLAGCVSTAPRPDYETANFQNAVAMLNKLQIPTNAKNWDALTRTAITAARSCLEVVVKKLDDGVSSAELVGRSMAAVCSDYFDVAEYAVLEGEPPLPSVRAAFQAERPLRAADIVIQYRAAQR